MSDKNPYASMTPEAARAAAEKLGERVARYAGIAQDYVARLEAEGDKAQPDPQRLKDLQVQAERAAQHADEAHKQQILALQRAEDTRAIDARVQPRTHGRGDD